MIRLHESISSKIDYSTDEPFWRPALSHCIIPAEQTSYFTWTFDVHYFCGLGRLANVTPYLYNLVGQNHRTTKFK